MDYATGKELDMNTLFTEQEMWQFGGAVCKSGISYSETLYLRNLILTAFSLNLILTDLYENRLLLSVILKVEGMNS